MQLHLFPELETQTRFQGSSLVRGNLLSVFKAVFVFKKSQELWLWPIISLNHIYKLPPGTFQKTKLPQMQLGGGFSNMFYFRPENWGRFPIWRLHMFGSTTTKRQSFPSHSTQPSSRWLCTCGSLQPQNLTWSGLETKDFRWSNPRTLTHRTHVSRTQTWVSNSLIATYWTGSVGKGPIQFLMDLIVKLVLMFEKSCKLLSHTFMVF